MGSAENSQNRVKWLGQVTQGCMAILLLAASATSTAKADIIEQSFDFSTTNQSMWGEGDSFELGTQWNPILWNVADDFSTGNQCVSVPFVPDNCAEITTGFITSANFGLGYSATAGSVDVDYPVTVTLGTPIGARPGDTIDISTSFIVDPSASIMTIAPEAEFAMTLGFSLAKARSDLHWDTWLGSGSRTLFDVAPVGGELDIINVNTSTGFTSDLLGLPVQTVPEGQNTRLRVELGDFGTIEVGDPTVDTQGGSNGGDGLGSYGQDDFLAVNLDLDEIIAQILGVGTFDWGKCVDVVIAEVCAGLEVISSELSLGLGLGQGFDFDPTLLGLLDCDGDLYAFNVGETVSVYIPGDAGPMFQCVPTFWLDNVFTMNLDFLFSAGWWVEFLDPYISPDPFGLDIGPAFSFAQNFQFPHSLYSSSWELGGFSTIQGQSFDLLNVADPPRQVPEPAPLALFLTGLAALMFAGRRSIANRRRRPRERK